MKATKQVVEAMAMRHGNGAHPNVGDLVDFSALTSAAQDLGCSSLRPNEESDLEDRARRNAERWGWINEHGQKLTSFL